MVVWSLPLPAGSEGPSLIPCAARLRSVGHHGLPPVPSWHTIVRDSPVLLPPTSQAYLRPLGRNVRVCPVPSWSRALTSAPSSSTTYFIARSHPPCTGFSSDLTLRSP